MPKKPKRIDTEDPRARYTSALAGEIFAATPGGDIEGGLRETIESVAHGHGEKAYFVVVSPPAKGQVVQVRRSGISEIKVAPDAPSAYEVAPRLVNAIQALGNNTVADLLGVSRSQPGRWARGEEGMSADHQAAVLDLDFVLSLLLRTMSAELAGLWLVSPNAHLGGGRPVDAFRLDGYRRVAEAIQAYADGAYA